MTHKKTILIIVAALIVGGTISYALFSQPFGIKREAVQNSYPPELTPDSTLIGRWTCPIGTGGTETTFDITAVSPSISGTVSGENSDPRYIKKWGPVNIGEGPGTVEAIPTNDGGITFTLPSGTKYLNLHLSGNSAVVDFRSVIDGNERQLTCTQ